jgi:hypothetical protein
VHEFASVEDTGIPLATFSHGTVAVKLMNVCEQQVAGLDVKGDLKLRHYEIAADELPVGRKASQTVAYITPVGVTGSAIVFVHGDGRERRRTKSETGVNGVDSRHLKVVVLWAGLTVEAVDGSNE